jgi:hypothetical protein
MFFPRQFVARLHFHDTGTKAEIRKRGAFWVRFDSRCTSALRDLSRQNGIITHLQVCIYA